MGIETHGYTAADDDFVQVRPHKYKNYLSGIKLATEGKAGKSSHRTPKDSLSMDVLEAERLGYGCHYGHYKADHPHTKEANEARLCKNRKKQPAPDGRKSYERVCPVCGEKFTTYNALKKYCSDNCKERRNGATARAKHRKEREEMEANHD